MVPLFGLPLHTTSLECSLRKTDLEVLDIEPIMHIWSHFHDNTNILQVSKIFQIQGIIGHTIFHEIYKDLHYSTEIIKL